MARRTYSKRDALEHIFNEKYDPNDPQEEIPFTRQEVHDAILATGGEVPLNLNNFVKDLVRTGNSDPRSPSAHDAGYYLREGSHSGSMGVFFRSSGPAGGAIAVHCPPELKAKTMQVAFPPETFDLIRPDEGGVLAALEYGHLLDDFFGVLKGTVKRVQSPVKVQPHELDSFFVMKSDDKRIPIACEAKSKGNDAINLNQIVGIAATTLQRLMEKDMPGVIPIGVKILSNGDIYIVEFPMCTMDDLLVLKSKLNATSVTRQARYRLSPKPPKW